MDFCVKFVGGGDWCIFGVKEDLLKYSLEHRRVYVDTVQWVYNKK